MYEKTPIDKERGKVSFALFLYPFEATNIGPAQGGENIEHIIIDGPGIEISRRDYPSDWQIACEDRLWWLSLDKSWLERVNMNISSNAQYELEFLINAINICINNKVFFTRFARREYLGIISNGEIRRPSSFHELVQVLERPLPTTIIIDGDKLTSLVATLFNDVLPNENHSDLKKAIESYRAAVLSFHSEVHVRLMYSVCENVLFTGYPDAAEKDQKISEISDLDEEEAEAWRHLVNRTKHPDEGTRHSWADAFEDVPPPVELKMREAANEAILRNISDS